MKHRKINMKKFDALLAETVIGPDSLVELEISADESLHIKIPVNLDDDDPFVEAYNDAQTAIQVASTSDSVDGMKDAMRGLALVLLSADPEKRDPEELLDLWEATGRKVGDLIVVHNVEVQDARERLGNFRYKG